MRLPENISNNGKPDGIFLGEYLGLLGRAAVRAAAYGSTRVASR